VSRVVMAMVELENEQRGRPWAWNRFVGEMMLVDESEGEDVVIAVVVLLGS